MKLLIILLASQSLLANTIKITSWFELNRSNDDDLSAEVCFKLTPKPTTPVLAEIIVDKGFRSQGVYTTWVGKRGIACKVVSEQRGRVQVEVETYLPTKLTKTK